MKIEEVKIKVRDLMDGYKNSEETGIRAYRGRLDIRPAYQREFVYNDTQRNKVIDTIMRGLPLSIMYWGKDPYGDFELIDGQQRTISICMFCHGDFSININGSDMFFGNLTPDQREAIKNYELNVYICDGNDSEKLDWFRTINIAGEKLTEQELRNAVYTGEWLADAKRRFSRPNCIAQTLAKDYVRGEYIRQEVFETALSWIADRDNTTIEGYMSGHYNDGNAEDLWQYFSDVIHWVQNIFVNYRKEMKNIHWGILYNKYKDFKFESLAVLEKDIKDYMMDDDVTKKSGIYEYVFDKDPRHLNIRKFSEAMKRSAYEYQNGKCVSCGQYTKIDAMEADHIKPWSEGGKTTKENCQLLCRDCNRRKSNK